MKKLLLILLALMTIRQVEASDLFINGMEDIPMPEKTVQLPSGDISFGNEETRLIEAYLKAQKLSFALVQDFYLETLPQLGWNFEGRRQNVLSFRRGEEELRLVGVTEKPLVVRLTLTGRP